MGHGIPLPKRDRSLIVSAPVSVMCYPIPPPVDPPGSQHTSCTSLPRARLPTALSQPTSLSLILDLDLLATSMHSIPVPELSRTEREALHPLQRLPFFQPTRRAPHLLAASYDHAAENLFFGRFASLPIGATILVLDPLSDILASNGLTLI